MRLRRKLIAAFFGVSSLLSVLLAVSLYRVIERQLADDLRDRLRDVALLGAHLVDRGATRRLVAQLGELDERGVSAVEGSADYATLSDQLGAIRSSEPALITYAYLLAPTGDPSAPRFIADADVLADRARVAAGERPGDPISHFNQPYDVSAIPLLAAALRDCAPRFEREFVRDAEFDVSSVSAYVPLADRTGAPLRDAAGRCLGVLGVDITDRKMRAALDATRRLAIALSLGIIAIALLVSIAMGSVLTRSILALTRTVQRFAARDFAARTPRLPRDEIGQLGASFDAMATTIQLHSEHLEDLVEQRTRELVAEKQTSERLLLNVLPGPIADRLKAQQGLIVDRFDAVSVLFADIVGFTSVASRTRPEELVTMLNEVFSMFDMLAERHGLEKIKTIGDAYMAVAGVPEPMSDHAVAVSHMAIDMIAAIDAYAQRTRSALAIRIGIHSGSVVAGVIGTKKFIYDLWGDTVNTASRMESTGVPGRVQVSEATYLLLRDRFEFEPRGPIDVKGKGLLPVFLLAGPRRRLRRATTPVVALR